MPNHIKDLMFLNEFDITGWLKNDEGEDAKNRAEAWIAGGGLEPKTKTYPSVTGSRAQQGDVPGALGSAPSTPTGIQAQQGILPQYPDVTGTQAQQGMSPEPERYYDAGFTGLLQKHDWLRAIWNRVTEMADSVSNKLKSRGGMVAGVIAGASVCALGIWYIWKKLKAKIDEKKNGKKELEVQDTALGESISYLGAYCSSMSAVLEDDESLGASVASSNSSVFNLLDRALNALKDVETDIRTKYSDDEDAKALLGMVTPMRAKLETAKSQGFNR